jgi:hypothetical protein
MSTVGPDHLLEVAVRLPEGVELVDAPVLGSVANATDGTLQIFVGASQASFGRCRELLAPLGTPIHLGPTGAGAAMKLVANATLAGLMGLVGEALALADGCGLDQQRVIAALLDSPIGPALSRKLDKIQSDHYVASFRLALMRKDLGLVLQAAERRGVELRLVRDAAGWIEQAERQGLAAMTTPRSSPRSEAEPPPADAHDVSCSGLTNVALGPRVVEALPRRPSGARRSARGAANPASGSGLPQPATAAPSSRATTSAAGGRRPAGGWCGQIGLGLGSWRARPGPGRLKLTGC